jgi:hypothetical protein
MRSACLAAIKPYAKTVRTCQFQSTVPFHLLTIPSLGQISLPETCPVCAHTPISSDLCKPNKALRTTLKAFLRTEEKKREKERQSVTPAISNGVTPADATPAQSETPAVSEAPASKTVGEILEGGPHSSDVARNEPSTVVTGAVSDENVADINQGEVLHQSIEVRC